MSSRTRGWLIFIVFLAAVTVFVSVSSGTLPVLDRNIDPKLGLDLSGGTQILLEAIPSPGQTLDSTAMEQTRKIIENRVNALGLTEPLVQLAGSNRILVELPNEKDPARAVNTIQQTGRLEFVAVGGQFFQDGTILRTSLSPTPTIVVTATQSLSAGGGITETPPTPTATATPTQTPVVTGTQSVTATTTVTGTGSITPTTPTSEDALLAQFGPVYPTLITGADLRSESLAITRGDQNQPAVAFEVVTEKVQAFADYSGANIGGYLCIVLDNRVQSCPQIQDRLPGSGIITVGGNDLEEAQSLLTLLRYGSLPVSQKVVQSSTIGPTLGSESINNSVVAGAIGLAAVAVFMILYYRLPGIIAVLALLLYTLTVFSLFKLIPVTLTLPGIAGFILSIGVAVDANVLIFERMKEELRAGRSLSIAVDVGFERAWPSIRDSNVSTLITCSILFYFGSTFGASIVKGFAITLALGVLVSLFTAIRVTRTLLHLTMDTANLEHRHGWFGV